jgi:hypothetical protein
VEVASLLLVSIIGLGTGAFTYFLLRPVLKSAYGALLPAEVTSQGVSSVSERFDSIAKAVWRISRFYALTGGVFAVTAGAVGHAILEPQFTQKAGSFTATGFVVGFLFAGLARLVSVTNSGFMLATVMPLCILFFALLPVRAWQSPGAAHEVIQNVLRQITPSFGATYVVLSVGLALTMEGILEVIWRLAPETRKAPFQLWRELREAFEMGEAGFYRMRVRDLCTKVIKDEVDRSGGLNHLVWKTGSGDEDITEAILQAACCGGASDPLLHLAQLYDDCKLRIIMPSDQPDLIRSVKTTLGVEPLAVPDIGRKRFLVVNRSAAVIGLDVPEDLGHRRGANFAFVTRDVDRVHDCIREVGNICSTHGVSPP